MEVVTTNEKKLHKRKSKVIKQNANKQGVNVVFKIGFDFENLQPYQFELKNITKV